MSMRNAVLIASRYDELHDDAFARGWLQAELQRIEGVRVTVADGYATPALASAQSLVTYIAETPPDGEEVEALRRFLERGGRWFALHTSNAVPAECRLPEVLGSRFLRHPPYGLIHVEATAAADPLLAGIEAFDAEDELYVCERAEELEVLLTGRVHSPQHDDPGIQPLMYRRKAGPGEVVYLALGHCNPAGVRVGGELTGERRGSWSSPAFQELVRRSVIWATGV